MKVELTRRHLEAILSALECEIPTRHAAAHNDEGKRVDKGPEAIDAEVPAMEEARYIIEKKLGR